MTHSGPHSVFVSELCLVPIQLTSLWPCDSGMERTTPTTPWLVQKGYQWRGETLGMKEAGEQKRVCWVGGSPGLPGRPKAPHSAASALWVGVSRQPRSPSAGWSRCQPLCLRSP